MKKVLTAFLIVILIVISSQVAITHFGDNVMILAHDAASYAATNETLDATSVYVNPQQMQAGAILRFTCAGTITGANAVKSVIIYVDDGAILTLTTAAAADVGDWIAEFIILEYTDTAHQKLVGKLTLNGELSIVDYDVDTTDMTDFVNIKIQLISGNAGDVITQEMCVVEYIP